MTSTVRTDPVIDIGAASIAGNLLLDVYPKGDTCVVHATGELDRASRDRLFAASTAGDHRHMSIDLSAVTFMDCGGYGGLVASRLVIERAGRTLTIRGVTGQPKHLLDMIEQLEGGRELGRPGTPATGRPPARPVSDSSADTTDSVRFDARGGSRS